MEQKRRKILEIALLIVIIVISVLVFLFREEVQALGNWGYGGLFLLCFLSNCTVFLPAPSLMVVVSFARSMAPLPVALLGALGTTLGEMFGYTFGRAGQSVSGKFARLIEWLTERVHKVGFLVFLLAFLPLPLFDFAGVYAGGSKMPVWKFGLYCFLGKALKMLLYAYAFTALMDFLPF